MENKYNIKKGDFINILSPMVQKLQLSGNKLLVFALIHGFSKDDEHCFHGSINYIACWLNISKNAVIDTLKVLCDANYLTKKEYYNNSIKFCEYRSNYDELLKNLDSGCEIELPVAKTRGGSAKSQLGGCEIAPNIYSNNNKHKNKFSFKQALLDLGVEQQLVDDWLLVRKGKKATNTETAFNSIKKQIELSNADANDCIRVSVERSWSGFKAEWYNNIKKEENINVKQQPKKVEWQ